MESMTGFGSSEKGNLRIEAKSINHRFLEINFKMSHWFYPSESRMRDLVKSRFSRGKIDITISFIEPPQNLKLNRELLKNLMEEFRAVAGCSGGISNLPVVINLRDLMIETPFTYDEEILLQCLEDALNSLKLTRQREGETLKVEMLRGIEKIGFINDKIKIVEPKVFEDNLRRLREKVKSFLKDINLSAVTSPSMEDVTADSEDILKAVVSYLERSDITEEIVRIESHIAQFKEAMDFDGPCGKRLDFIIQELLREFNTIGSKSINLEVTNLVVNAKTELEKLREQVQNIE